MTQLIKAENMTPFFEVKRERLQTESMNIIDRDALFNENGELLGVVSPNYKLVTNQEVVNVFDEFFNQLKLHSVTDKVSHTGGKWMREYVLDEDDYTVAVGKNQDVVKTKVTIYNGYDGKSSVGMNFSAWRQVCSNGMMGWKKLIGRKFGHFSNNILGQLESAVDNGFNEMAGNFKKWDEWSEIPFTEQQFEGFIDKRSYLSDKQKKATTDLYPVIMNKYNEEETKWGAYNVLTAIASHHTASRGGKVAHDFSNAFRTMTRVTKDFYDVGEIEKK